MVLLRDLFLQREDVAVLAVVLLGEDVMAVAHVDEMHADAQPVAVLAHAAAQDVLDAELLAEGAEIVVGAEVEGHGARDHAQLMDARERVDQLLGHPIAEMTLIARGTEIGERQHRDRLARRRRRGFGGGAGAACRREHFADEAEAAAIDGADPARLGRGIAERAAGVADRGGQRGFRNVHVAPDRVEQLFLRHDARRGAR